MNLSNSNLSSIYKTDINSDTKCISSLYRINTENGYIKKNKLGQYEVIYYLKDHLGNVKFEVGLDNKIHGQTNYYPFGMEWNKSSDIEYAYNGKEKIEVHGFNMYDYGARFYDQTIGRWHSMDPLAEKYYSVSPYNYCNNNPIKYIDPDGKKPTPAEAARIAAHVYGDKKDDILIGDWKVSDKYFGILYNDDSGLNSNLYEKTVDGITEYVYATAGTDPSSWADIKADMLQPFGLSKQYSNSIDNARNLDININNELTFVGHSLGGGQAAANAMATGRSAVTFNAAGVGTGTKFFNGVNVFSSSKNIDAYIMKNDPLNNIQNNTSLPSVNGNRFII